MKGDIIYKTTLVALVFFTLVALIGASAATAEISKEAAYQIVIGDVLDGEVGGKNIYVSEVYLTPGFGEIDLPEGEGWYFFIDDQPEMDWAHPCRYIYVDNFGNATVESSNIPPRNFEDMILLTTKPAVTTPTAAATPEKFHPMEGVEELVQENLGDAARDASEHCYAVLISGGVDKSNNYYPRYYGNISSYYKYLKTDLQYPEEHIYVLYADGNDTADDYQLSPKTVPPTYGNSNPDFDGDGVEDIDYACTSENLTMVFDTLSATLGPEDYLFIYVYDHGGIWDNLGETENATIWLWNWEEITDDDFADNVSKVNCAVKMVVMGQCYSGGMVQELVDANTNITVAASCGDEPNRGYMFLMPWLDAHKTDYDPDSSCHTEQDEAYDYAKTHANQPGGIQPRYDEKPAGFGETVCLCKCSWTTTEVIEKGLCWLYQNQNIDGSWGSNVGYTSLAALAFLNAGFDESDPTVSKAINYILSKKHDDGSIYTGWSNYETSLAILPLVATHNSSYDDEIAAARTFLVNIQNDESEGLTNLDWTYGGWGYGANSPSWSDLSNTQWSLMGLDAANLSETSDTWSKGELYVTRCQNLQATNSYAVTDDGGFTYQPPSVSMAWGCNGDTSQSYGAMSATGVWSLRLCGVDTSDQRVQEGLNWLRDNYAPIDTVGNPCYGDTYLYYYLLSFAKTLIMTEIPSGSWQETASQDITDYIVSQQHDDGHWSSNEGDLFATEQAILALQTRTIPTNVQRLSWLTFILHSNADLHVYDPLGRHVGMNYDTGEIEIEIPSATYSADPQNITIPELVPGNYRIVLVGTGTGEYTLDVTGGVGDDIVADDSFTATISEGEVHDADVNVAMITWLTIHIEEPDPVHAMVESATGTGNVSFVSDAGTIEDLTALNESDLPEENPGADFPHGLFSFNITGLSNGEAVNVTINFPEDIPTTAEYWKYNTSSGEWYQIPIGSNDGDHIITITLQDGGIGDNDGATNGIISDPGGPGVNIYNITFLPPITTPDHFNLTNGRTLPIKFTARDNDTGEFIYDDTVNVTITNSTGHLIAFFTNGTGTDSVRINSTEEQYTVNFHTKDYDLNVGESYTIHVTFGEADALRGYAMTNFTLVGRKH